MNIVLVRFLLAAALVVLAAAFDLRNRRIPNWLNLAGLMFGLFTALWLGGPKAGLMAVSGAGLALLIYFPLWMLRAMGAGDVKLMVALGAILGPAAWLSVFVLTALYAGILGFLHLAAAGRLGPGFTNVGLLLGSLARLRAPFRDHAHLSVHNPRAARLPHGASIALGCLTFVVFSIWR